MRRRSLVRSVVALPFVGIAGCTGAPATTPSTTPTAEPDGDGGTTSSTGQRAGTGTQTADSAGGPTPTGGSRMTPTGTAALDLREANVTGVSVSRSDGRVDFDVTLYHDDDGEAGYANWWQVERLDGTRLGRRDLLHAHGTREFTRSDTFEIPDDVACVVVRGHDRTHGYGGRAALVNLETGTTRFVDQGPEPRSFSASDCP